MVNCPLNLFTSSRPRLEKQFVSFIQQQERCQEHEDWLIRWIYCDVANYRPSVELVHLLNCPLAVCNITCISVLLANLNIPSIARVANTALSIVLANKIPMLAEQTLASINGRIVRLKVWLTTRSFTLSSEHSRILALDQAKFVCTPQRYVDFCLGHTKGKNLVFLTVPACGGKNLVFLA